ncbi:MAG: hypothetical protein HQL23_02575 [Candidatus Omnitrophica bacterium]|nr:hypothetical protein [Candidatus Omnitrophota bacterium]
MKTKKTTNAWKVRIQNFVGREPVLAAGIVIFALITFFWVLSSLELIPERAQRVTAPNGTVFEPGDSVQWIGMDVIPLTRTIRKEFKIPGKIKGMFVQNEGKDLAQRYGVKTGDILVSIGRKSVATQKTFVNVANNVKYSDGILLEIFRDGKIFYLTIPFEYQYGPLLGPNKGSWQLGSPVFGQAFPYGPVFPGNNPGNNQQNRR